MFIVENRLADEAVRRNVGAGGHYFDKDTMRAFGSRVHEGYDAGDGATIVIMSNKDKGWWIGGKNEAVCGGRRHYFLIIVNAKGDTAKPLEGEFRYDVSKETGYWFSLRDARAAAKRLQKQLHKSA